MTSDSGARKAAPEGHRPSQGGEPARTANREEILKSVKRAESDAAKRREAAERKAAELRANGQREAAMLVERAEVEGRALVKNALADAAEEMERARKERLAKVRSESDALMSSARLKFPELTKAILKELEGGKDA